MSSTLTVHHLRRSQSERVTWLCEELEIPYKLVSYDRDPQTMSAPEDFRKLHWAGTSPIIEDGNIVLAETGAVFEYIQTKYANGRLSLPPTHPQYADYLFWLHRANGTLQPGLINLMFCRINGTPDDDFGRQHTQKRIDENFQAMDLQLSRFPYLAGDEFTAADCMTVWSLTTLRLFIPYGFEKFPNIVKYLERISQRPAFKKALEKGDPGLKPVISVSPPENLLV
ncbi:glutathione S-transferase [Penicillium atrosanguineum]|uniref:glutathione transferase n=1 Tax=Penicillium atrosanguineum TaxID=1132637 RepID=A0A9W9KW97_9EURO|nr:glucan 1-4-alpha-glucosidase [Penicillium atrosanguineum]KAJ5123116.1 glutathione S-transferase [Penicillium atrosanguineum]KAJ5141747.1 glutathione S-transferase [Penicillium atrosanguineum]KAJ5298341.1 glucan 1-4-alpha-glucosidase [Penicillium atrosanguineum]KAJ5321391.1 glutathione S-transferase [Penicillium atrosanguineum]